MKAWFWHHVDTFFTTLARFARAPFATLFNVGVIGIALALPAGLYVALANLQGYAQALASDPQLSVFLALDAGHAADICELFRSFNQVGVTVVIATHEEALAARLKPRIIALKAGAVVA